MIDRTSERTEPKPLSAPQYRAALLVIALCALNFVTYIIAAANIGGDAVNGKIVGGHFYLGEKGNFTEVTEAVYTYSLWHTYIVFASVALFFPAMVMMRFEQDRRRRELVKQKSEKGG